MKMVIMDDKMMRIVKPVERVIIIYYAVGGCYEFYFTFLIVDVKCLFLKVFCH
jgi:hypothetical protein